MGKFMVWLLGVFPQWKPDKNVALTWAQELPDITAEQAKQLVRTVQAKKPMPFPPSVFEIVAETRPPKVSGHEVFQKILDFIQGSYGDPKNYFNEKELTAIRRIGGLHAIGNSKENDPYFLKSFIGIWNDVQEEEYAQLSIGPNSMRQIGNGERLCEVDNDSEQPRRLDKGND